MGRGCSMGKKPRTFTEQYKREAVRFLEETGRPVHEVAEELKVSPQSLYRWQKTFGSGRSNGAVTPSEAEELRRLRRENEILRQERDFLKKATAYFASPSP